MSIVPAWSISGETRMVCFWFPGCIADCRLLTVSHMVEGHEVSEGWGVSFIRSQIPFSENSTLMAWHLSKTPSSNSVTSGLSFNIRIWVAG